MRKSEVMGPVLWVGLCAFAFNTSTVQAEHTATGTALKHKPALHRHKRDWLWKSFFLEEEKSNPPHHVGKLTSTKANDETRFVIEGEGANTIFHVSSQGDIYATKKLDREVKSTYHLTAHLLHIATNKSVEPADQFNIQITDLNDNKPQFTQSYNGSVPERSEPGTNVLTVTATDADDPTTANGQLEYKLLNGTDDFEIDRNGRITAKIGFLDREKKSMYLLVVHANDMPGMQTGGSATTTVTVTVSDINDNMATFKKNIFSFDVEEDKKEHSVIGTMEVEDKDEEQNKDPIFTIVPHSSSGPDLNNVFNIASNLEKNGVLTLKQPLDFESRKSYTFDVRVHEDTLRSPPDSQGTNMITEAKVIINVLDVDEPPIFSKETYSFTLPEDAKVNSKVGGVLARDPDAASQSIRYSIDDQKCPVRIHPKTGDMYLDKKLDRELTPIHTFRVTAEEPSPKALKSYVTVNLVVLDVNDNAPEMTNSQDLFACENDGEGTVIRTIGATDKDEHQTRFSFSLAKQSPDFSLIDNGNNTANIIVKRGGFSLEDRKEYLLEIVLQDGGLPPLRSTTTVNIRVCSCGTDRKDYYCKPAYVQAGISVSALIAILLCIFAILVIVILIIMRKRYQKDAFVALGRNSGEIHEQLVSYDEEGGGEMDTNGYDVSILTSARNEGSLRQVPCLYNKVQRPPADRGNMAMMIEVKKDEADHDRDSIPYDTLHIYGYEGPESLASSLSSLEDSSFSDNDLDYDFLNDWGPHFRTLAGLYGVDSSDNDCC
ncbi:cadherin-5-like [Megalops cyprinoides]|uniref:cadherin-5-like n=1 Tax=Megalops cyprinoides TaxID=118141 RepID=UPI001864E916|nr:cadherin-5-like [Megalops cyprinoides]